MSGESMEHLVWHQSSVTKELRNKRNKHRGVVVWFTGLSGSGKSMLAHALEMRLFDIGCQAVVLDGDNVRHGLCSDLSFSESDRKENIRRVGEVAKLFVEAGIIALTAFISPFREDRERVRSMMTHGDFFEIFVSCPMEICEQRDVKGLYKKAREGIIINYTGIASPYEPPERPESVINSDLVTVDHSIDHLVELLRLSGVFDT